MKNRPPPTTIIIYIYIYPAFLVIKFTPIFHEKNKLPRYLTRLRTPTPLLALRPLRKEMRKKKKSKLGTARLQPTVQTATS